MSRKFLQLSLVVTLAFATALAQHAPSAPPAPSVERLREHVAHLASEKLDGRRTGTPGASQAAEYIAAEFARLKLRATKKLPAPVKTKNHALNEYFQPFPYVAGVDLGKRNQLQLAPKPPAGRPATPRPAPIDFRVGNDWMPLGFSSNGVAKGGLIFVGYGITDAELNYNDYPVAAQGRIALAMAGTPDGDNPHGKFDRHAAIRWKAIAARNAGAKALLIISREETLTTDPLSKLTFEHTAGDTGLPVAIVSRQAAAQLCGESNAGLLTEVENRVRLIIANQLKKESSRYGLASMPNIQEIPVGDDTISLSIDVVRREAPAVNVIGILDGSDPRFKNEAIVIGAHYDHLGRGGAGSLAQREGEIHYGADDNASGTAGVLELARIFAAQNPKPRRTIVFIAFSGEEEGLLGSNYYVNHPVVPLANTVAMLNMDMIGRMKNKRLVIGGVGTAPEWRSMIEAANFLQTVTVNAGSTGAPATSGLRSFPIVVAANGRTVVSSDAGKQFQVTLNEDGFGPSDHSSFYAKQIPVLFFWTGTHEDYHKPSDTADKINYEDLARIVAMVTGIVRDVDAADKRPTYTVAKTAATGRATGFRVYLGTIPNYADSNDGLLLDGVRDDSPSAKAGLKAGDRIMKLAGREVRNVYDYTYALGEMKAGQEYEVEVMRGSERLTLKLIPAARN